AELRLLESEDHDTREAAVHAARELLRSQRDRVIQFTEHVMLRLLAAHRDTSREVCLAAEECLELVVATSDPRRCLAVLIPVAAREETPVLQASIRLISRIVPRMGAAELQQLLPQLLPPLFDAFKSPSADVRKAVVFALVDMYLVLGDELTPHLSELSTSQLKLVTIYINRTTKARVES
ncbi:armadillo-type protein, partial [Pavlovales sp. CCMP2436]